MKKYGIYIAYPPTINLFGEGLVQHLLEFLKGAQAHGNVCFVIACPSWLHKELKHFFTVSNIQPSCYEIISPDKKPLFLSLYQKGMFLKRKVKRKSLTTYTHLFKEKVKRLLSFMGRNLISLRVTPISLLIGIVLVPLALLGAIPLALVLFFSKITQQIPLYYRSFLKSRFSNKIKTGRRLKKQMDALVNKPKSNGVLLNLYYLLLDVETKLMLKKINLRKDVAAWYSPTVFWPSFNEIAGPKLTCVPDVVLSSFPVGFALIDEQNSYTHALKQVEKSIAGGSHFVTYSSDVKWNTLVKRYQKNPAAISVVTHGANQLNKLINVSGFKDDKASTDFLCRQLFYSALSKQKNRLHLKADYKVQNGIRFIFYASQFRPNKNLLSLLKAYNYLLKERYVGVKLILTGDPEKFPEVNEFVQKHQLMFDVLFVQRLTHQELAACYRLADLAVNPSFSEGGCPFTFTEALSVDTPVVMARIAVTEEVISCKELQASMFFDPYDWQDMANRIEWGLKNRATLLEQQKPFYNQLAQRTWKHVVDDYITILEQISDSGNDSCPKKLHTENA